MKKHVYNLLWAALAVLGAVCLAVIGRTRGEPVNSIWLVLAAALHLSHRLPLLRQVHRRARDGARRRARHAGRAPARRPRFRADQQVDRLRPSLRGDRRAGTAGRSDAGGAVRLSAGHAVDHHRRGAGRRGAGFRDSVRSMRRDGKSLGQMAREEIGKVGGFVALVTVLLIMIILLAVVALVVVNALKGSPWGTFTIAATMPIALFMGLYLRYWRPGKVLEVLGDRVRAGDGEHLRRPVGGATRPALAPVFTLSAMALAIAHHHLRISRQRAAGLAAARAARLSEHVRQAGRGADAGRRNSVRAAGAAAAARSRASSMARARSSPARSFRSASSPSPAARSPDSMR